ncbi:hypothetical protein [Paenibacillus alvei]|nr:hypothetical protein [Paenibacillus alvei]
MATIVGADAQWNKWVVHSAVCLAGEVWSGGSAGKWLAGNSI